MFNNSGTRPETRCGGTKGQTDMRAYRADITAKKD